MGTIKELKKYLKENLDTKRYRHVLAVRECAEELAVTHLKFKNKAEKKKYLYKVAIAALAHDIDKGKDPKELYKVIKKSNEPELKRIKNFQEVYHAFSGAIKAKEGFDIEDEDVLNAIKYHTTGRVGMSELEKIIYLADYIEPGRSFHGVEKIRKLSKKDLDKACHRAIKDVINFLKDKKSEISDLTLDAEKYLKKK